jgi:E3 ubiquitin-protein ligase UBR1
MVALIDRFGLSDWFSINVTSPHIWESDDAEPKQFITLLEDLVMLVIHLVSDTGTAKGYKQDRITRKHIVHQLALANLQYSELVKKLPERAIDGHSILPYHTEVADFKPPP